VAGADEPGALVGADHAPFRCGAPLAILAGAMRRAAPASIAPLSLALSLAIASACGGDDDGRTGADADPEIVPDAATALAHRTYEHPLPDCEPGGLFNCTPSVHLCADGSAIMLVTDIANGGTFTEDGAIIVARFEAGDVPETVTFTASEGGLTLVDDWQSWQWQRNDDPAASLCP